MLTPRSSQEYLALSKKASIADRERVAEDLRNQALTVLWVAAPEGEGNAIDLQAGTYIGSRFDCLVVISFSKYGDLCMVSHSGLGGASLLPRTANLDGILVQAGWLQVPDEDITTVLDERTDADVLGTFFNMY